jgi:hypothetical protein
MSISNGHCIQPLEPPFYRLSGETCSLNRFPNRLLSLETTALDKTDSDEAVCSADYSGASVPHRNAYLTGRGFRIFLRCQDEPCGFS